MQRLDQDVSGRPAERDQASEQLVDQLVRQLADEVALPVVPVLAVRRIDQALLVEERMCAHRVLDEPRRRAQQGELVRIAVRPGVAREHDKPGDELSIHADHGGATELTRGLHGQLTETAKCVAHAVTAIRERPADDAIEWVQTEFQTSRHTEVAAATAEPPEQLLVLVGAGMNDVPGRRDDLRSDEVVARQTVLRGQVADTAAERQPAHARGADHTAGCNEAERLGRCVEVEPGSASLGAGDPSVSVDLDRAQLREIDHEPVLDDAMAGRIVPASAHGDVELVLSGERECGCDILGACAAHDHGRPAIDERVEAAARSVVLRIRGHDHRAGQRLPERAERLVVRTHLTTSHAAPPVSSLYRPASISEIIGRGGRSAGMRSIQSPLRRSPRRAASYAICSNLTEHPSPVGDWAAKPTDSESSAVSAK